jgi:hypothetical protein
MLVRRRSFDRYFRERRLNTNGHLPAGQEIADSLKGSLPTLPVILGVAIQIGEAFASNLVGDAA